MVTTEPNLKKFTKGNARKTVFIYYADATKIRKTRVVIHLSTRSYVAMYRVREGKSILLEPFYQLFRELFCHIFGAPGLMTCWKRVWNYCYVYQSDLTPFKYWSGLRSFLGLIASFLHARLMLTSGRQW